MGHRAIVGRAFAITANGALFGPTVNKEAPELRPPDSKPKAASVVIESTTPESALNNRPTPGDDTK